MNKQAKGFRLFSKWGLLALPLVGITILGACSTTSSSSSSGNTVLEDLDAISGEYSDSILGDHYRAMYEIVPYTFSDSNGDGIGDLKGIEEKLDYIADLYYDGIWCTPIVSSPTYHKYDSTDYYSVDEDFGTLADFDSLVDALHERDMTYIFDLAINHTSVEHEWFVEGAEAYMNGDAGNKYAGYYNFETIEAGSYVPTGYSLVSGSSTVIYECRFWSGMPDLNLQVVLDDGDGDLATEIKNILKFWLVDHDVDGFRLDAVTSYFTGDTAKNTAFLKWLNDYVKSLKPEAYIVGEGAWGNYSENQTYASSGVDSFFDFNNSDASGIIASSIRKGSANGLASRMQNSANYAEPGIAAPFVANHDKNRMVGVVGGRDDPIKAKLGHALLQLCPGATWNYYGDEIGMAVSSNATDSDPNKRLHMYWGDNDTHTTGDAPDTVSYTKESSYPYESVADQLSDSDSILNYVKRVNRLRRQFPAIARGSSSQAEIYTDESTGGELTIIKKEFAGNEVSDASTIFIALNLSEADVAYGFTDLGQISPLSEVSVEGKSTYRDGILHVKSHGLVVLG